MQSKKARKSAVTAAEGIGRSKLERAPALADTLALRLREEIDAGCFKPGEQLPTELQISEAFGVSRPTVREAIGRLKQDGLVVTRQGAGAFVADPGAAAVLRLPVADPGDVEETRNIIELLMAVAVCATQHAAERRTPAGLAEIEAHLDAVQQAIDRGDPGVDEDLAFHRAIIEATGNPYFHDLWDFLDRRVRNFFRMVRVRSARQAGLPQAEQAEHVRIFEAIARQDGPAARAAAEEHIRNAAERAQRYMKTK